MYKIASQNTTVQKSKFSRISAKDSSAFLSSDDFLFSQATIVSSVICEPHSYLIDPETSIYVNQNGDCWSNESLKANYKSFIGAYNYKNHIQVPEKAVGFIADTVLRRIPLAQNKFIYYCDILVATHRDFTDLIKGLLSNEIEFMSMGCDAMSTTCSRCGHVYSDEDEVQCEHILEQKGKYFTDSNGKKRIIAELLGTEKPNSVVFTEASWLTQPPAFDGAHKRNILQIPRHTLVEITMPTSATTKDAFTRFVNQEKSK